MLRLHLEVIHRVSTRGPQSDSLNSECVCVSEWMYLGVTEEASAASQMQLHTTWCPLKPSAEMLASLPQSAAHDAPLGGQREALTWGGRSSSSSCSKRAGPGHIPGQEKWTLPLFSLAVSRTTGRTTSAEDSLACRTSVEESRSCHDRSTPSCLQLSKFSTMGWIKVFFSWNWLTLFNTFHTSSLFVPI